MNIPYARSDRASFEIQEAGAFAASPGKLAPVGIDVRDHANGCVVWLLPVSLGPVTQVDLVAYTSDDGTTIPVSLGGAAVSTDANITNGMFTPKVYKERLSIADGTLAAGVVCGPLRLPQHAGVLRIAVVADQVGGSYALRAQRLS